MANGWAIDPIDAGAAESVGRGVGSLLVVGLTDSVGVKLGAACGGLGVGASLALGASLDGGLGVGGSLAVGDSFGVCVGGSLGVGGATPASLEVVGTGGVVATVGLWLDREVGHCVGDGDGAWPDSVRISSSDSTLPQTLTSSIAPMKPFLRLAHLPKSNSDPSAARSS